MVVDHQPFIADAFKEVRGKDFGLLRFVRLLSDEIFDTNNPGHVARDLDHHVGQLKLHGKGIIEDEHPRVTHVRPS